MLKLQCFIGWVVQQFVSVFVSTIYIIYRFDTRHFFNVRNSLLFFKDLI